MQQIRQDPPIRVILVDDERPARERLRQMLAAFGDIDVVAEAADGDEALERIEAFRPDLVFLDIQMPGRNGLEVVSAIPPPRPHIIFCTAYDEYAVRAFELYAADYLLKPVSRDRLQRALERVLSAAAERDGLRRELEAAQDVQTRLFPQELPLMKHLDFAGFNRPASSLGGDYYDFLPVGPDRLGLALGDVSGKGLYAALLMAGLQGQLRSRAPGHGGEVHHLAAELNHALYASTEGSKYVTLFYAAYDDLGLRLSYVNAGHHPPVWMRFAGKNASRVFRLRAGGMPLGLFPETVYERDVVRLEPEDLLVLFSDGLTEARSSGGKEFGEIRLMNTLTRSRGLSAREVIGRILDELATFTDGRKPEDDLTLVVARVGQSAPVPEEGGS